MSKFQRVEFKTTDGTTLRGNFYQAKGEKRPIIIMADGFSLLKEHIPSLYVDGFVEAGYSALIYDHRGYGSSEGFPRQETNPRRQSEDLRDAITAARNLPGVDKDKVVLWGIGHATMAVIPAATDPRVKAVICQGVPSGSRDARSYPAGLLDKAWQTRDQRATSGKLEPTYVKMWPDSIENANGAGEQAVQPGEAAFALFDMVHGRSSAAGTPWENKVTVDSFRYISATEPYLALGKITQPLLYVTSEDDPFTGSVEQHRAQFGYAGPNAEFKVIAAQPGVSFDKWFAPSIAVQVEFLARAL